MLFQNFANTRAAVEAAPLSYRALRLFTHRLRRKIGGVFSESVDTAVADMKSGERVHFARSFGVR